MSADWEQDEVVELVCQMDDMTGESLRVLMDRCLAVGVRDVFATPICMKKGRMGYMLTVLAKVEQQDQMIEALLSWSTTAGVRYRTMTRAKAHVGFTTVQLPEGEVVVKEYTAGDVFKIKPESDDVRRLVEQTGASYESLSQRVQTAYWLAREAGCTQGVLEE